MWIEQPTFLEDLKKIHHNPNLPWKHFEGHSIFVTGATGLIGYSLVSALLYHELQTPTGMCVIALVRDLEQAKKKFSAQIEAGGRIRFAVGNVEDLPPIDDSVDYIVHCACPTDSSFFLNHPVEVLDTIVRGTKNVLELGKKQAAKGVVFLSSMEVYGQVDSRESLKEEQLGFVDLASPRSSYPVGKRLAENMCASYAAEYQIPVCVARLAQTFGPGVVKEDQRVFAYMARCATSGQPIRLKTSGAKESMYVYTADAVSAILILLGKGQRGQSYNIANPDTYCSIKELAQLVSGTLAAGNVLVETNVGGDCSKFRPEGFLKLDASRMMDLGWKPTVDLSQMFIRMADAF